MFKTKEWLLVGTMLLDVALGSAHATPFDGMLVIAQTPQADQEKEKKPPQRPSPPPPQQRQVQPPPPQPQVQPPPPPPQQINQLLMSANGTSRTFCVLCYVRHNV
jgi:outer membrane biosynthesis protein TonB